MARKLFICCAALALCSLSFAQNATDKQPAKAREAGSGIATGKRTHGDPHVDEKDGVTAPRDSQSGQASGKSANPLYEGKPQTADNPLYKGNTREAGSGMATGKRTGVATGAGTAAGGEAVVKTKTKSNQSNDRLVNAGPKDGFPAEPPAEAAVVKTKTKSNQSNDRTASGGDNVAIGDLDGDGAANRKATKSRSNIQNNRTTEPK